MFWWTLTKLYISKSVRNHAMFHDSYHLMKPFEEFNALFCFWQASAGSLMMIFNVIIRRPAKFIQILYTVHAQFSEPTPCLYTHTAISTWTGKSPASKGNNILFLQNFKTNSQRIYNSKIALLTHSYILLSWHIHVLLGGFFKSIWIAKIASSSPVFREKTRNTCFKKTPSKHQLEHHTLQLPPFTYNLSFTSPSKK